MLEMIWKPTLYGFDTCKEFAEAFRLNRDDLILSNAYIYEPYFGCMENLNCYVIFQEKYGAGEPTDVMVDAILADAAKTSCKRVIAIGGGTVIDIAKVLAVSDGEKIDPLHIADDLCGVFGRHLRAVLPVHFIAVVLLGIMARRDHDAGDGIQFAHGKGQHGNGVHVRKQIYFDAVEGKNVRRGARKHIRVEARIVRDDDAALRLFSPQRQNVFRQPLRRPADGVDVHHVGSQTHDAAHARSAEFQIFAEAVLYLLFIRKRFELLYLRLAQIDAVDPSLIFLSIHNPLA